jgi:hypothetical protein
MSHYFDVFTGKIGSCLSRNVGMIWWFWVSLPSIGRRHKGEFAMRAELHSGNSVKKCWRKCIVSEGAYFEGDEINLDD